MCKWQVSALLRLTSKIWSFRRFGCSAVRGMKTALAVLAMLASVLAWDRLRFAPTIMLATWAPTRCVY